MPTINPKQVAAFRAVMLTGGITRAAAMVHLTQPAVSRLIKEFELTVGLTLFERTGSGIVPTREANVMFAEVERLFTGLDRIMELAIELREEPSKSIRIGAFPALGIGFFPHFFSRFHKNTPDYVPSLFVLSSADVVEYVATEKCDIGLTSTVPEHPLVSVAALQTMPFVVVMRYDHPLAALSHIEPKHLQDQDFISTSQTVMNLRLGSMFASQGVSPKIVAQTSSSNAACAMVGAGMGISIVDPFAAQAAKIAGVTTKPLRPSISFEFAYLLPAKKEPFSIVTETVKALQDEFEQIKETLEAF